MSEIISAEAMAEVRAIVYAAVRAGTCGGSYMDDMGARMLQDRFPDAFPVWYRAESDAKYAFRTLYR